MADPIDELLETMRSERDPLEFARILQGEITITTTETRKENLSIMTLHATSRGLANIKDPDREMILKELISEGFTEPIERDEWTFSIGSFTLDELPSTHYERQASYFIDLYLNKDKNARFWLQYSQGEMLEHLERIKALERSIFTEGIKKPILLNALPPDDDTGPRFDIGGGNHRVQAIKNLVGKEMMQPDVRIPAILSFNRYIWERYKTRGSRV